MKNIKILYFLNTLLIILTIVIPLSFLNFNSNSRNIAIIQKYVFITLFLGTTTLAVLNQIVNKSFNYRKKSLIIFELIGMIGILYSAIILVLILSFRKGIGF